MEWIGQEGDAGVCRTRWRGCQRLIGVQVIRRCGRLERPVLGSPPFIAGCARFAERSHHVVTDGRLLFHAVIDPFQVMVEPADSVGLHWEFRVLGIEHLAGLVDFLLTAVQPRAEQKLLLAARVFAAAVLAADIAVNGADGHEVVPTADGEAGDVHFVKEAGAVLLGPVGVVGGVGEPVAELGRVVLRHAADFVHRFEPLGPRGAADAVAFVVQRKAGIDHVLGLEMRRLRNGQKILGEARLRAAERADRAAGPRLRAEPLHQVISVLKLSPTKRPIPNPGSLRKLRAAEVSQARDISSARQLGERLPRARVAAVGIPLLQDDGPGADAGRKVQIGGKLRAVSHGNHHMLFQHPAKIHRRLIGELCWSKLGEDDGQDGVSKRPMAERIGMAFIRHPFADVMTGNFAPGPSAEVIDQRHAGFLGDFAAGGGVLL